MAPVLQVRRMLKTRSSRDFSLAHPMLLCVGFVLRRGGDADQATPTV